MYMNDVLEFRHAAFHYVWNLKKRFEFLQKIKKCLKFTEKITDLKSDVSQIYKGDGKYL